jgi:uncharacterized membrane protein
MRTAERCAIGVVVAVAAVVAYRAWTQSLTIDEARNYKLFIAEPLARMFSIFDTANHVLQSLLSKVSIGLFGLTEFTLRLPSVLGGLLYFVSVYRLSRYLFGAGWLLLLAVLALGLNPGVLDYMVAARGYGLGLGLMTWALSELVFYFGDQNEERLFRAGIGLGLSVTANLVFVYPAAALGTMVLAILALDGRRIWMGIEKFAGPGIVAAFLVLVLPMSHAQRGSFWFGVPTLDDFLGGLVSMSYFHNPRIWSLGRYVPRLGSWEAAIRVVVLPAFFLAALAVCVSAARRWARTRRWAELDRNDQAMLLVWGAMALMLAMVVAVRHVLGVLYPFTRMGIYLMPIMTLLVLGLIRRRYVGKLALVFTLFSVLLFGVGFTPGYFTEWAGERHTKDVMRLIEARHGGRPVRLGTSWPLEATCNFYRVRFRLDWMQEVASTGADGDFDYYYILREDEALIGKRGLRTLFRDPLTGTTLAEKP